MNHNFWFIFFAQILFWLVFFSAFISRYLFKTKKLSVTLFIGTLFIDFALLFATTIAIKDGTIATIYHGLAAVYIGLVLFCGRSILAWIDNKFKPATEKQLPIAQQLTGKSLARYKLKGSLRHLYACFFGSILLIIMVLQIDNTSHTKGLTDVINLWLFFLSLDFLYSLTFYFWPKKNK